MNELDILIIDDDEDIREYTTQIISEWKGFGGKYTFVFHEAVDGLEGLQKLHERKYDLAVVDMKMPKLSGTQLIEALRTNMGENQEIPIIVSSGFPQSYMEDMKGNNWTNIFTVDKPLDAGKFHRAITFAIALKMKQGNIVSKLA